MDREELIAELERLVTQSYRCDYDATRAHVFADRCLLKFIDDPEITRVFTSITRWYSIDRSKSDY